MLLRLKLRVGEVVHNPNARVVFILGTLIIAALVGGAPSDSR
jgi:hypothetical protein